MKTWSLTKKTWSFTFNNIFQEFFSQLGFHLKFLHPIYEEFFFFFFFFFLQKPILVFPDVAKLIRDSVNFTEAEAAKIYKRVFFFITHEGNSDQYRCQRLLYKNICLCFKGTNVMS